MGTFTEWLEYGSYSYLATTIAVVFFPDSEPTVALIQTFAVFALSFLMRPIGGLFWGHFGDRVGRQRTLAISIIGMGVSTLCIGVLPGYATIGFAAPVLLLLFRLTQSFSAAGEYSGAAVLLAEHAPAHRRARWVSAVPIATAGGFLAASVIVTILNGILSPEAMQAWGWRVPFLVAAPLTAVAWYIRRRVAESPVFRELQAHDGVPVSPLREGLVKHWRVMLRMLCVMAVNASGYYLVLSYMATYIEQELGLTSFQSSFIVTAALVAYLPLLYVGAWLADRVGRRRILLINCVAFIVLSYPAFVILGGVGFVGVLLVQIALVAVFSLNDSTFATYFVEGFPAGVRFTGFALPFNVGVALFGGVSPLLASWLIATTGNKYAPAFIIIVLAVVGMVALVVQKGER
jgi:MHS family proline/betaine transporter-like MFS transporter